MPRGDGTGPWGLGPMTGRAAGYCAGYPVPGYANPYVGWRGLGPGRGRGRGFRRIYYATGLPGWARYGYSPAWGPAPMGPGVYAPHFAPQTAVSEEEFLREQAEFLKGQLEEIEARLKELSADEGDEGEKEEK